MADPVLDLPLRGNIEGATTIREYLCNLLLTLWDEGEGFSGKRPFGNSGWDYDLLEPLLKAGLIEGKFDENGYVDEMDEKAGNDLIRAAIRRLCGEQSDESKRPPNG